MRDTGHTVQTVAGTSRFRGAPGPSSGQERPATPLQEYPVPANKKGPEICLARQHLPKTSVFEL